MILSPVEILWRMLIIFVCFSRPSAPLGPDWEFLPTFCGLWIWYHFSFNTYALLFGSSLHTHGWGISLGLGQASELLACFFGSVPHTCSSDLYWFRHKIRRSISPTLCSLWLPPHASASRTSSSPSGSSYRKDGFLSRDNLSPPFSHAVLHNRGCPQVQSNERKRRKGTGIPLHSLVHWDFFSSGQRETGFLLEL